MSGPERPAEPAPRADAPRAPLPEHVRALRLGHGANCSSVGSVVDTLFVGAALGGAVFAAICAAMRDEPVRVVGLEASEATADAIPPRHADGAADADPPDGAQG